MPTPIRFTRTPGETLTLVTLPPSLTLYCAALSRETEYAVLVEYDGDGQLCDLDGDTVSPGFVTIRDTTPATSAPEDVIDQIEAGWETGTTIVAMPASQPSPSSCARGWTGRAAGSTTRP